jgi:hypothetical protein
MIKEFAFGLSRRHYFQDAAQISEWIGLDSNTFMSLYDYDDEVKDYFAKKKTLSGYTGKIYMPDEFILDVDGSNVDDAYLKTGKLINLLESLKVLYHIYFSGTGFHLHISGKAFRWKPDINLHARVKKVLGEYKLWDYADPSVTDKTRIIRVPNTKNTKSNLYKVWIEELKDVESILKYAKSPKDLPDGEIFKTQHAVFDLNVGFEKSETTTEDNITISHGRIADPVNYPCISNMLGKISLGKRHMVALRLSAWFRWLYPEDTVRVIMESWRKQVDNERYKFTKQEMSKIIDNCYEGHAGAGYRYGCNDPIMDEHCKNTCRLYKAKKSQSTMSSGDMEIALINFIKDNVSPCNIGHLYGQHFPIYPGEVVILQAPPASMKTMLLQNWMVDLKKTTYFMEMEMSPRQIWSRFVMIEMGWTEEELIEHYNKGKNGMDEKFKWLTVDYASCYPYELEKRIIMQANKPEIVVVDHMGLFKSKYEDNNRKVEEASQALMELAVKHNIIVFAVSEISKQAFNEGMNIASAKGSFRIAYNANKLLSVKPLKNQAGLIEMLHVTSTKNREKEQLNVQLKVENVRISKYG